MTTCNRCGRDASGAFCANCGADLRGPEDATSTSGTSQSAPHREGWHDESTYTGGYASYRSNNSANPGHRSYVSNSAPGHSGAAAAAAPSGKNGGRSNQMLATLVGIAAVAVFALVAYLIFKPGSGSDAPNAVASTNNTVANSPAASSSTSTVTVPGQAQQTVTQTSSAQAQSADSGSNSGGSNTSGGYTYQQSGDSVTITDSSGNQVGNLHLNGYRSDRKGNQSLSWAQLSGCNAPILVWNAGNANSSGAFSRDSSGQYQLLLSNGTDLEPTGGSGEQATTFGVHDRGGRIGYVDSRKDQGVNEHIFDRCTSDGSSLHFAGSSAG